LSFDIWHLIIILEENKNLEATEKKKPGKSWLFWIGVGFIALAIGLTWWLFSQPCQECYMVFILFMIVLLPLGALGIVLILVNFILKLRKKRGKMALLGKIMIIIAILIIVWSVSDIVTLTTPLFSKIGAITKSEFICSKLPALMDPTRKRDQCYLEVARYKKDPLVCQKVLISFGKGGTFDCYSDIAQIAKNETVCENIKHSISPEWASEARARCVSGVAQIKKDESVCEQLTKTIEKEDCYSKVAIVKDPALCQKITDLYERNSCNYKANRAKTGDISRCEELGYYRDECLFEAALARNDFIICEKIKDSFTRSVCRQGIE